MMRSPGMDPVSAQRLSGFMSAGQHAQALREATVLLRSHAQVPYLHNVIGTCYARLGHSDAAVKSLHQALRLDPDYADAHCNLAAVLRTEGEYDNATEHCERALELKPAHPQAHQNLGVISRDCGFPAQAVEHFRAAIAAQPDYAQAHFGLGDALLVQGEFAQGWSEYEWRWRMPDGPRHDREEPLWDGRSPKGKTILLHAEQGFGDTLQFIRFAPAVRALGATVVVLCQPPLKRILESAPGIDRLITKAEEALGCDLRLPLATLPAAFIQAIADIPSDEAYLSADDDESARFANKLSGVTRPRVGVVWRGSAAHVNDANRSLEPETLLPLLSNDACEFIGLQKQPRDGDINVLSVVENFSDLSAELHDFADTAAALKNLDLLISVDTSVAHLAGALGVPCWILLPHAADWRWLVDRTDSPWYRSVRLFRQPAPRDWASLVTSVDAKLRADYSAGATS